MVLNLGIREKASRYSEISFFAWRNSSGSALVRPSVSTKVESIEVSNAGSREVPQSAGKESGGIV